MGLPAALRAHASKEYNTAAKQYQRALDQKDFKPVLFQNYGALLRQFGKLEEAKKVYEKGISLYPEEFSILRNYANLIKDESPSKALSIHYKVLHLYFKSNDFHESSVNLLPIIHILKDLKYYHLALDCCRSALKLSGISPDIAIELISILGQIGDVYLTKTSLPELELSLKHAFDISEDISRAEFLYSLSWLYFLSRDFDKAFDLLSEARSSTQYVGSSLDQKKFDEINKTNHITTWNASCVLLKAQDFVTGWKFFDSGLRAPASGAQAWQRALPKPFTAQQIPLWRGESLIGKSVLLLEEQAIGDVMQFMTLVPSLLLEVKHLSILLSDRLLPIYERHFSEQITSGVITLISFEDIRNQSVSPNSYDYQSPLGSVCQYRFSHPRLYGTNIPSVSCNSSFSRELRKKYESVTDLKDKYKFIGISWRGGGTHNRIKQKSIPIEYFFEILKDHDNIQFISLQYGETKSTIDYMNKRGVSILVDNDIDPLKNMDNWLSQVAICDSVISVANTTIHGSGGLDIPTLCLLSQNSDWRWFDDPRVDQSYWYPSVNILRESKTEGWKNLIPKARKWILDGCPSMTGTSYTV